MDERNISGNVNVSGSDITAHISTDQYVPFKVEITNQPIPPYVCVISVSGWFHIEARKGYLIFRDMLDYEPAFILNADHLTGVAFKINDQDNVTAIIYSKDSEIEHSIRLNEEIDLTPDFFVDLLEATKTGERLSTKRAAQPTTEEEL